MIIGSKKYPSPEEIMNPIVAFKPVTVNAVMDWKLNFFPNWNTKSNEEKLTALEYLIQKLCVVYGENVGVNKYSDRFSFSGDENTINLDKENPSIVSTLHEFRHKINGSSEASACRWSVQLFKKCFPKSFDKLMFKPGTHLLIRKE